MDRVECEVIAQVQADLVRRRSGSVAAVDFHSWSITAPKLYADMMEEAAIIIQTLDEYRASRSVISFEQAREKRK